MKAIYISHPFSGDERVNTYKAQLIAAGLSEDYPNMLFVNPINAMRHLRNTELSYEVILGQCIELMKRCDAVIMVGNWRDSIGCNQEYQNAKAAGMTVYDGIAEFKKSMKR